MSLENSQLHLPEYDDFVLSVPILSLNVSASGLHGIMCGHLCAGADSQGEAYLRALLSDKKDERSRSALLVLFSVYAISQQQLANFDFEFELLLPDADEALSDRAQAFTEWCEGFIQGLTMAGVGIEHFYEEDTQETYQHLVEFAALDCDFFDADAEDDERALMEVSEFTRMAILQLHRDLMENEDERGDPEATH
ncbi:MAG: UPF0149 family protein [Legionellales bacterium]